VVKVRDGQVANRPIYAAIGVSLAGEKDVLGLWAGTGGEGAKFWMSVLTDLRNRGVKATFFVVCSHAHRALQRPLRGLQPTRETRKPQRLRLPQPHQPTPPDTLGLHPPTPAGRSHHHRDTQSSAMTRLA